MGFTLLYYSFASYFRISERCRLVRLYLFNRVDGKDMTPYRKPSPTQKVANYLFQCEDGSVRLLLSPNTAATSYLHVSLLSISPDAEIPSMKAPGVEFYYVMKGYGAFSQQGVTETCDIKEGDFFVVDAGNIRWITNTKGNPGELLLLRATDGGNQYNKMTIDRIRADPYRKRRLQSRIESGLQVIASKAKMYYRSSLGSLTGIKE